MNVNLFKQNDQGKPRDGHFHFNSLHATTKL